MAQALAGLVALAVAMGIGRFAFTPLLPMMQQDAGLSLSAGGWLASANYLGYLLGALSATALRIRPANAIRAGLVTIVVVTLGMGASHTLVAWLALRALAGTASAWVLVFTSSWCLERLAQTASPILNGIVFAGVGSGIALAGIICLALMQRAASSAQAWTALGVVALAGMASVWRAFETAEAPSKTPGRMADTPPRWDIRWVPLVLCYGVFGFGYIIPATFVPVMARQFVTDPLVFGWTWPVFGAAAALTPLAAAVWARRIGVRRVWIASQAMMAVGVAVPVLWPAIGGIMVAALFVGGTFMVITMSGMQEARAVAGRAATPLMAAMTSAFGTGQIAGPIVATSMLGADGGFSRALLIACALLLATAALLAIRSTARWLGWVLRNRRFLQ
jgi:MFS family permease